MKTASGIVAPIVKSPHALSASALTTTMPRPASAMTTMKITAMEAVMPAIGLISVRAISPSDRPPRRVEPQSTVMSCTAPARQQPATSQMNPGANPNCAASVGPTSGPAPVMAAKWWPKSTHRVVG